MPRQQTGSSEGEEFRFVQPRTRQQACRAYLAVPTTWPCYLPYVVYT